MGERWKPLAISDEYPGYEVSDQGNVRSTRSHVELLIPAPQSKGYLSVNLSDAQYAKSQKSFLVHRLVLEAFRGSCPEGQETRHLNGDKSDNRLANLRWGTRVEQHADKVKHGTALIGEKNHKTKLTTAQVVRLKKKLARGASNASLAEEFGVTSESIGDIKYEITWKHVPWPEGFKAPKVKPRPLNAERVADIKRRLRLQEPVADIARLYGVSRQSIYQIKTGKTWTEVE